MKTPTLRQKVDQYESFLHKINLFIVSCNNDGIKKLITNADIWSYAHRAGNGELDDDKQQSIIDNAFWKLLDTPETDAITKDRQHKYTEMHKNENQRTA